MVQEPVFHVSYETTVTVAANDIDTIMAVALNNGVCHWCKKVEVVGEFLGSSVSEQISRGGVLIFCGINGDKWTLTRDYFLQGLRLWLMNGMDVYHGVCEGLFDSSVIDKDGADCIIQYALFGTLAFG